MHSTVSLYNQVEVLIEAVIFLILQRLDTVAMFGRCQPCQLGTVVKFCSFLTN